MPLHLHLNPTPSTHIWIWETTESNEELLSQAKKLGWSPCIADITSTQRQREIICTHLLMSLAGIKKIDHEPMGNPYCQEYSFISLSHSKKWIALATHDTAPIGIDIECETEKVLKVATRFMSEHELTYLSQNDLQTMLVSWCAKEASYKIIGSTATDFRASLRIHPFAYQEQGMITVEHLPNAEKLTLHYQSLPSQYTLVYGTK